jgi:hypothetical protein
MNSRAIALMGKISELFTVKTSGWIGEQKREAHSRCCERAMIDEKPV